MVFQPLSRSDALSPAEKLTRRQMLASHAQRLRDNATSAEDWLWEELQKGWPDKETAWEFKAVIGDTSIVDFFCSKHRMVVEVDGGHNETISQMERDLYREQRLRSKGFRVIRFTDEQVLYRRRAVLHDIRNEANRKPYEKPEPRMTEDNPLF